MGLLSGSVWNESVKRLLSETDRVLLDIKYTNDAHYHENVGCGIQKPLDFLAYLNEKQIPTTIRQVNYLTVRYTLILLLKASYLFKTILLRLFRLSKNARNIRAFSFF